MSETVAWSRYDLIGTSARNDIFTLYNYVVAAVHLYASPSLDPVPTFPTSQNIHKRPWPK